MTGHIKIGAPGDLRDYVIANLNLYSKGPSNQYAAKLSTGAGDYDDLQNWSYWVQDNWQMGVGQKDAEASGFLYGELETRYPEQVLLSRHPRLEMYDNFTDGAIVASERTIGPGGTFVQWARLIPGGAGRSCHEAWVYLANTGATVKVHLCDDTGAVAPGTVLRTGIVTTRTDTPGYSWYHCEWTTQAITSSIYWITLEADSGATVPTLAQSIVVISRYLNAGGSWVTTLDPFGVILNPAAYGDVPLGATQIAEFNNELYAVSATSANIYKRIGTTPGWTQAAASVAGTQLLALGEYLYIALDSPTDVSSYMDAAESATNFALPDGASGECALLCLWGGYLWAAYGPYVYYTNTPGATGADWTQVEIGLTGERVTGLAGLGDYLYVATERELVYVGFGDAVLGVTVWGSPSPSNGKGMMHYQGQIFIPLQESLIRFDGSAMLPIGVDLNEGLPAAKQGNVAALTSTNNWLLMGVNPRDATTEGGTVWAWTTQGWHHIAHLPPTMQISCLYYRRSNQRLYVGTSTGHIFSLFLPDVAGVVATVSPEFAPHGWMETDWFFGGLKEVEKDFESVYISGEDFAAGQFAQVYWKDDDSTGWELLGTVDSNRQELRWANYNTRPSSRQLKIGIALYTRSNTLSPVIRAVRVKYHPMVNDWFRWNFPILVSDNQQMPDGTINPQTASQMAAHLDEMITRIPPFIYQDVDGVQYEVKVMGSQAQVSDWEWYDEGAHYDQIYNLTLEQIRSGTYQA